MSKANINKAEPLHKFGQFHPKAAIVYSTSLEFLALLTAADDAGPLRASVRPLSIPFALTVRVANAQQLHSIARCLCDFSGVYDAIGMVGRKSNWFQVFSAASSAAHGTAESLVSKQEKCSARGWS